MIRRRPLVRLFLPRPVFPVRPIGASWFVGGGSFGATLVQHLLALDTLGLHRILVLEAGPYVLPEHVQNLPVLGLVAPGPTTVDPGVPRAEVWGLPWRTNAAQGFPGLAYCTGGRSLFWGGWSPQLLVEETPPNLWPAAVLTDLRGSGTFQGYFAEAAEQIGVTQTNDFVFGAMHRALRKQLFDGLQAGTVPISIALATLPLAPLRRDPKVPLDEQKLEAPLAVQGRPPRPGFFPFNKFSGMPLLIRASRTIESTRLALLSFDGTGSYAGTFHLQITAACFAGLGANSRGRAVTKAP